MAENEAEAEGGGASLIFLGSLFFYGPLIGSLREDADEPRLSAAGPTFLLPSGFGFSFFFSFLSSFLCGFIFYFLFLVFFFRFHFFFPLICFRCFLFFDFSWIASV